MLQFAYNLFSANNGLIFARYLRQTYIVLEIINRKNQKRKAPCIFYTACVQAQILLSCLGIMVDFN